MPIHRQGRIPMFGTYNNHSMRCASLPCRRSRSLRWSGMRLPISRPPLCSPSGSAPIHPPRCVRRGHSPCFSSRTPATALPDSPLTPFSPLSTGVRSTTASRLSRFRFRRRVPYNYTRPYNYTMKLSDLFLDSLGFIAGLASFTALFWL